MIALSLILVAAGFFMIGRSVRRQRDFDEGWNAYYFKTVEDDRKRRNKLGQFKKTP